jgi:AcrR family transcriptional regulator
MDRRSRSRDAVLGAATEVMREAGVSGFTVEAVAKRSGVAKTTIYRQWPTGELLLLDTLRCFAQPLPTPNTGDLRTDLARLFEALVPSDAGEMAETRRVMFGALQAAADDPELQGALTELLAERMGPIRTVVELAKSRGDLPADLDLDMAVDLIEGPFVHRYAIRGLPIDQDEIAGMLDRVVASLRHQ